MKYKWEELSVMFGQLGFAAKQLSDRDRVAIGDGVPAAIVAAMEESAVHSDEIISLTLSEPV